MIGRLSGRASFERIRQSGSRVRAGVLWCTFVLDPLVSPPRVAFAIGRAVGPAVTRNRLRRRLRSLLQQQSARLPAGLYLFGVTAKAGAHSFAELMFDLARMLEQIPSPAPPSATPSPPSPSPA